VLTSCVAPAVADEALLCQVQRVLPLREVRPFPPRAPHPAPRALPRDCLLGRYYLEVMAAACTVMRPVRCLRGAPHLPCLLSDAASLSVTGFGPAVSSDSGGCPHEQALRGRREAVHEVQASIFQPLPERLGK